MPDHWVINAVCGFWEYINQVTTIFADVTNDKAIVLSDELVSKMRTVPLFLERTWPTASLDSTGDPHVLNGLMALCDGGYHHTLVLVSNSCLHTHSHTLVVVARCCLLSKVGLGGFTYFGDCVLLVHQLHHLAQKRTVLMLEGLLFLLSFDIVYEIFDGSLWSQDTCQRETRGGGIYIYICIHTYVWN